MKTLKKFYVGTTIVATLWVGFDWAYDYVRAYDELKNRVREVHAPLVDYSYDAKKENGDEAFKWLKEKGFDYPQVATEAVKVFEGKGKYSERDAYILKVLVQYHDQHKWEVFAHNASLFDPVWKFASGDIAHRSDDSTGDKYNANSLTKEQVDKVNKCYSFLKHRYTVEAPVFGQLIDYHDKTRSPECEL